VIKPFKKIVALMKIMEVHLLNNGHFALEEDLDVITNLIKQFLGKRLK
jgi:hypothetical protein